jgi:phosphoserine phosphatase
VLCDVDRLWLCGIINPDPRLKRIAKKRSWPIERW